MSLDDYQRRAKRTLRLYKEKMARRADMGEIEQRLSSLEEKCRTLNAKIQGLTDGVEALCDTMDRLVKKLASMTGAKGEVGKEIAESMQADLDQFYNDKVSDLFDCIIELDESRVLCDLCGKDWTDSDVSGGFMFAGKSCCPECAPGMEDRVNKEKEEHLITARCPESLSHADWITKVIRPLSKVKGGIKGVDIRPLREWMKKSKGKEDE